MFYLKYKRLLGRQFLYLEVIFEICFTAHYALVEVQRLLKRYDNVKACLLPLMINYLTMEILQCK